MSAVALLLLLLAPGSQVLLDEVFHVPATEWRYVPIVLQQPPVLVQCEFQVLSGSSTVRVTLVNRDGLDQLRHGDREPLGSGAFVTSGEFSRLVSVADSYAVVLENGRGGPAAVRLRVSLDFSERSRLQARYLSPQRRVVVILVSAMVFLSIVIYSARKLLGAIQ